MHGHPRNGFLKNLYFFLSSFHRMYAKNYGFLPGYCNHLFLRCVQNWCHGSHLKLHIGSCSGVGHEGGEPGRVHDQVQPWQWRPGRQ